VIACTDPPWGDQFRALQPQLRRRVVTYGTEPGADVIAQSVELSATHATFDVTAKGLSLGRFTLNVTGRHNVQNALAAVAVGRELELTAEQMREGLAHFRGVDRRFQVKAEWNGITVVDDYGHHPTEIRTVLETARLRGAKRIWAIFQPHRYTRTKFLMDDFARCFDGAERVFVLDIYPASEPPIPGITTERLIARMRELGFERAQYAPSEQTLVEELASSVAPGDLVLTIGAGSVWKVGEVLADTLRARLARSGSVKV